MWTGICLHTRTCALLVLQVMGMKEEFDEAAQWVEEKMKFNSRGPQSD